MNRFQKRYIVIFQSVLGVALLSGCETIGELDKGIAGGLRNGWGGSGSSGQTYARNSRRASRSTARNELDVSGLIQTRLDLPIRPIPPQPPRLTPEDADLLTNTPAEVRSSEGGAFDPRDAQLITVIGRESLVGGSSAAGQFVSDLLFAELQKRDVSLADRDYRVMKLAEYSDIVSNDIINLTPLQREEIEQGEQDAVSFYIVVHAVKVPNNPVTVEIPWRVTPEDWDTYENLRDQYLRDVANYNTRVHEYESDLLTFASKADESTVFVHDDESSSASAGLEDELTAFVESHPDVARKRTQERRVWDDEREDRFVNPMSFAPSFTGAGDVDLSALRAATNLANVAGTQPAPVDMESVRLFESPDDVFLDRDTRLVRNVQAFQGAVSVRIIDLKTSRPIWFGLANSQDRNYTEAIARSCAALAEAMLTQTEDGR